MEEVKLTCLFVILFINGISCEGSDPDKNELFSDILKPTEECKHSCDETYSRHTYPKTDNGEACYRGCRLYTITEFVDDKSPLGDCKDSCTEAYAKNITRFACTHGCDCQDPISKSKKIQRQQQAANEDGGVFMLELPSFSSFFGNDDWSMFGKPDEDSNNAPTDMQSMLDNFFGKPMQALKKHATNLQSRTWSFIMSTDSNGRTVVIESPPQTINQVIVDPLMDDVDTHNQADNDNIISQINDAFNNMNIQEKPEEPSPALPDQLVEHRPGVPDGAGFDWLGCISDRSGLPRWFLVGTVFLSVLAFVWLCFATHATAPDHHTKGSAVSEENIKKDLQYMQFVDLYDDGLIGEKAPLYDAADVHQAPPLPIKMDIKAV